MPYYYKKLLSCLVFSCQVSYNISKNYLSGILVSVRRGPGCYKENAMYIQEPGIAPGSEYYIYSPGRLARELYFSPLSAGVYSYMPGYLVSRNRFDSYLVMYIKKGSCEVKNGDFSAIGKEGDFVLLDCYCPHSYRSSEGWEALWLHFDGPLAKAYFDEISGRNGQIFSNPAPSSLLSLENILHVFRTSSPVREADLSRNITTMLDSFLAANEKKESAGLHSALIWKTASYISRRFHENISLETLASQAGLSPYYFLRLFASETGFTPHQYLVNTRIDAAKFLLRSPEIPIKDICVRTGFSSERTFCSCFKKSEGITPGQYRKAVLQEKKD